MSQHHQQPSSAVNGSECYYCWITQYDKCTSNCNQYRAVPRYGNFDIEPSGKMRLRTTEGNQTYTEWCEQQEAKKKRDRLMSHSRYDLIQERKWQWANRTEIADGYSTASTRAKESARFSSLIDAGVRNGTVSMPEDSSPRVTRITPSASTLTGGGSYVSSRPYYYGAERGSDNVLNEGSAVSRGGGGGGEVLEIRSCRKPVPAEVPYKYAHGSTKVQITPYTIATVPGSRNYHTAVEHDGQYPPQNDGDGHDGYGTTTNSSPHQNQYHARRSVSASISRGGGGSTYQPSQQRGPSPSVSRPRGSSVSTIVSRSRSTLGLVTTGYNHGKKEDGMLSAQGGGVGRNMVGSRCTVASDIVESEILSNRYTSAHEMPLPLIFYS